MNPEPCASPVPLISKYTSLIPCRWGWYLGLIADPFQTGSMMFQGEWAPQETGLMLSLIREGQTVLDIGANAGSMTLAFAAAVGQSGSIFAFEPQRYPFLCLAANIALNSLMHYVQPIRCALGSEIGSIDVPILEPGGGRVMNFGGVCLKHPERHTAPVEKVEVLTIDSLDLPACHFIKADIEGMEAEALRGGRQTIIKFRPTIWAEQLNHEPGTREGLQEICQDHNYRGWRFTTTIFDRNNTRLQTVNPFCTPDGQWMNDQNVLMLPREVEPPPWAKDGEVFWE